MAIFVQNYNHKDMKAPDIENTALLVHIEHTKPIPVKDFAATMEAYGNLYASFVESQGIEAGAESAELYVEKIEHNCIDVFLCDCWRVGLLPFAENINTIFEFGHYIKGLVDYFSKGRGKEPALTISQLKDLREIFDVTVGDPGGTTTISVVDKLNTGNVFNNCTFNFSESNSAQNQIGRTVSKMKAMEPDSDGIYKRVLMTIHQHRNDNTGKGNQAIVDSIIRRKHVNLLFETDELRDKILRSDENPAKKAYQVDIEVQTVNDKIVAYKVIALHDIIDIT